MTSRRFMASTKFRRATRRLARELLICLVLPFALMLSVAVTAQKTDSAQQSQPQQRTDEQIVTDINSRLATSSLPNPLNFNIFVHDGTATLRGTVPTAEEHQQAVAFIKTVPGVKSVDDQLTVGTTTANRPPPPPPPANEQMSSPDNGNLAPDQTEQPGEPNQPAEPSRPLQPGQPNYEAPPMANGRPPQLRYPGRFQQPMVTIAPGTPVHVMMLNGVDSKHTKPGARFRAVVVQDVILPNGATALPRGAYVAGTVVDSRGPGHLKGHPKLALQLSNAQIGETSYPLSSYMWDRRGPGKGGQTTGNVVGGAAGGAIIGGAVGGGPTALLGAALGGLGGAGLSALSGGARLVVPAESVLTFYLNAPVTVREPTVNEMRSLYGNVPPGGYGRGPGPYGPGYQPPPPGPPGGYPY